MKYRLDARQAVDRDLPLLSKWWVQKGLPQVPKSFLPRTGLVVEFEGTVLCGGFLVQTDTNQAAISFISANPECERMVRSEALDFLIIKLAFLAKDAGYEMITAATNVPALQARYERLGFESTDKNVTCFGRNL